MACLKRYYTGDPVTKERIQDEPWYPRYQEVVEFMIREGTDVTTSLSFFMAGHPGLTEEQDAQVLRWIVLHVERRLRFEEAGPGDLEARP